MKDKKQFLQITAAAFVVSLVTQILSVGITLVRNSMIIDFANYEILYLLSMFNMWVSFTIAPILIFTVFYFIGKKPNLLFELKPIMLALLIGNIASLFVSSILHTATVMVSHLPHFLDLIQQLMLTLLPAFFLSSLAGLSIGYIRQKKLMLTSEPEPS